MLPFQLRPYRPADCASLAALFYDTVHTVNAKDYTNAPFDAWADGNVDPDAWNASFLSHTTYVAVLPMYHRFSEVCQADAARRLFCHKMSLPSGYVRYLFFILWIFCRFFAPSAPSRSDMATIKASTSAAAAVME